MERDKYTGTTRSELGLQVIPQTEGVEIIFTASDGSFSDLPTAEKHYADEINSETKELRKLQALMTTAAFLQAYGVIEGIRDENLGVIIPIIFVAGIMVYVRNKSMVPTKEKRDISKLKLGLIQEYENSLSYEITDANFPESK